MCLFFFLYVFVCFFLFFFIFCFFLLYWFLFVCLFVVVVLANNETNTMYFKGNVCTLIHFQGKQVLKICFYTRMKRSLL